jgi:hypothetical protein
MTDRTDIARLRGLLERATKGRWYALLKSRGLTGVHVEVPEGYGVKIYHADLAPDAVPEQHERQKADAALVAEAVNALPALLAELERLRRVEVAANSVEFGEARIGGWQVYRHAKGEGWTCFHPYRPGYIRDEAGNVRRFVSLVEAVMATREADKPALPASAFGGEG